MPITSPNLDDLRFASIVEGLRRRIPVYTPEWTDHNESDPGITLIHLFAHLAEQVGYRLNRVPEKTHVALLKLLGARLLPAHAATTSLAFLLANPATLIGYSLAKGSRVKASGGDPPPTFETDKAISVVPAQPVALLITKNPYLYDLRSDPSGVQELPGPGSDFESPMPNSEWLDVVWDGKKPKLKDMPIEPVSLASSDAISKPYLWIGVDFNADRSAGFRGVRVTLTIQLDDDEQPSQVTTERCEPTAVAGEPYAPVTWLSYYDEQRGCMKAVPGRIDDSTERLRQSGAISFEVPDGLGAIPADKFVDLEEATSGDVDICGDLARAMQDNVDAIQPASVKSPNMVNLRGFQSALANAISSASSHGAEATEAIPHPLDPALRLPRGWLRIDLPENTDRPKIRMVTFNAVTATHATTKMNELLGTADGTAGQSCALANGNVLPGTLAVEIQEEFDGTLPLVAWSEGDLDEADPFDRLFDLDPEAGTITFGDGRNGRIPPLVPGAGRIVARSYRYGGGASGNVPTADIASLETPANGVSGVVNFTIATGGRDAEDLEAAKQRVRKELSTRHRAVTASDFEWIASQTPTVEVGRVHVVPLRSPLPDDAEVTEVTTPCGPDVPSVPAGLASFPAHGAVAVVVVPQEDGPEPTPTPSFLRAVCEQLDAHRLVTTEVCVVPPQYVRLCNFDISVRAQAGYTRADLQDILLETLSTYLHVLTGGEDGAGYPFGTQLHIAQIAARIMRAEGVDRLDSVEAEFVRTKSDVTLRQGKLVQCVSAEGDTDRIDLAPEETASLDTSTFRVSTVVE